jgi:4-amino-4-deoxy-L-arabinose transferase-like glycosyltransferase
MLGVLALAAVGCLLGVLSPPGEGMHGHKGEQLLDLVRVLTTVALSLSLLFGPGVAWRLLSPGRHSPGLAFLFLPGLFTLFAGGVLAWALGGELGPRVTCFALMAPLLGLVLGALVTAGPKDVFSGEEQRTLLVCGCVLGLAVARALWSLGPEGELYGGTVSRTLEVGDRSDSRISFILPQLVAHHEGPFGPLAWNMFLPYNFSSRGPVPGLASTPVVLMTGGHPPATFPEQVWAPFDHEGFAAYRLAMMTFACTAFLSLWDLIRRLAGPLAARLGVLLAATTPFLVHEVWFTWPKMLAAALILAAAICVIERRPFATGLLAGLGYLMHPVALLSLPALGLLTLWPLRRANWKRPRLRDGVMLVAGLVVFLVFWRIFNGSHYDQNQFLDYFTSAGPDVHPHLGAWLEYRLHSLGDTVVPLLLPLASADNPSINVVGGISPAVVHFFFQYWNTVPFGVGIVFVPMLLVALWRALWRWPWAVVATVLIPFALFAVYWGSSTSGLMREGLQPWALTLIAVVACEQAATHFGWLRSSAARVVLVLRVVEVAAVAVVPTLATRHLLVAAAFPVTDTIALIAMAGFSIALGALVWALPRDPLKP